MDVRFSNVVEVTRQYFQGVPPAVGSGPPAGQAPAQRPPNYWAGASSQSPYPPVSSAPSPLPYPNQQQPNRLPSIGAFTNSSQQRTTNVLPSVSQIKQGLSVQDYPPGYPPRVPSGYKYPADQQASAALYNPVINQRQAASPRTQPSSNGGTPSSHASQQSYHQTQSSSHSSYHVQPTHLHQLAEAAKQLSHLQANQGNHISSQSQISHPRQSPLHSTHQQILASQQLLTTHMQHSQQNSGQELPRRSPVSHQAAVQLLQSQRQSIPHSQQDPSGSNHLQVHQQMGSHMHQQVTHRQQVSQQSSHRMQSPASSHSGLSSHHLSNHSSHFSTQLTHHQSIQSSSLGIKSQTMHQQTYSHSSSQQMSHHQLVNQLQPSHQSVNTQSQTHHQSSYHQQHHISPSNQPSSNPNLRLPTSSPIHQSNSVTNQSQPHHINVLQQHRSSHTAQTYNPPVASSQSSSYQTNSTSFQNSFNQGYLNNSTSRLLGQLNSGAGVTNLSNISPSLTRSRENLSVLNHSNVTNMGSISAGREVIHSTNHKSMANLVTNTREGSKAGLPSISNLMNATHHQQANLMNSRSSTLSQTSPVHQRKSSVLSSSAINLSSAVGIGDPAGVVNLSDGQTHCSVNLSSPSPLQTAPNPSSVPSHRSIVSGVVKRESPLDLSVKTIRQSADSTAADEEYLNFMYNHAPDYFQRNTPPHHSTHAVNTSPFDVTRNTSKPVSAPKVDFTPDFSSSAHIVPIKKKKANDVQQYVNNLPSIGSFAKPQLPRTKAEPYSYYQSGPSTSSIASYPQSQQVYGDMQKSASTFPAPGKRPSEEPTPSPKIPRTDDSWRLSIDRQIENKLNSYLSSKTMNGERSFEPPPQNFRFPQYPQPQIATKLPVVNEKPMGNGQADKRVLNILRTSLETREARNKATVPVVADRSPKVPVVTAAPPKQNLPPFGAIGTYPKEVAPIENKPVEIVDITDDTDDSLPKKAATNGSATNGELDGLAAFLAARIRTKAELKQQVDPGGSTRFGLSPTLNSSPSYSPNIFIPRVIKTEEEEADTSLKNAVKTQTTAVSPPKLTKEHGVTVNIPRKRDSDSECEMPPVLERQRKSSQAAVQTVTHTHVETHVQLTVPATLPEPPPPPVIKEEDLPEDERNWLKRCDELIDQLQKCPSASPRKKKFRKKRLKIKRLKEETQDVDGAVTKREPIDPITPANDLPPIKQEPVDVETELNSAVEINLPEQGVDTETETEEAEVQWQRRGKCIVRKKKPLGDGSHFVPGWQDEVYRYKQSLRMPNSLISIARPTSSLPDLQNYMDSPIGGDTTPGCDTTPESTPTKPIRPDDITQSLSEEKTILDKLMERFKLNRTEPEAHDANNPYMDYLNKERRKVRGRSQSRKFIKKKATFKEIFGEERPASAPPAGVREGERKKPSPRTKVILRSMLKLRSKRNLRDRIPAINAKPKKRRGPRPKSERERHITTDPHNNTAQPDTVPPNGDKPPEQRRTKYIKRKGKSSGFDYIKKKKKINKEQVADGEKKPKKKKCVPMTIEEIKEELKTWVLNKESGETILQRAARLGYTEVVQYCLSELKEKATCKDHAGFTPLHEAASQGHIDIAKLLLDNGAIVNEPAQGGIRPLHEAAQNGFTDLMEILLRFGANPDLSTCSGHTALSLATDIRAKRVIEQYRCKLYEPLPTTTIPEKFLEASDEDDDDGSGVIDAFEIEESDIILPSLYRLCGESRSSSWILYHELAPLVRAKTKDSLLRRLGASTIQDTRDLKPSDFYSRARTRTLVMGDTERKPPKLGIKMSRVTLIRYTQAVKLLLDVETTLIPR